MLLKPLKKTDLMVVTSYARGRRLSGVGAVRLHVPIQVEIVDNGPGIAADLRDHIFDPFVSGKSGEADSGSHLLPVSLPTMAVLSRWIRCRAERCSG